MSYPSDFGLLHQTLGEEAMTTRLTPDARRRSDDDTTVEEDIVIEALTDFPDNVIAIACHGHVTKADYETVLIPDIEDKLSRHKRCASIARSRLIMSGSIPARSAKIRRWASATSAIGNAPRWSLTWNG